MNDWRDRYYTRISKRFNDSHVYPRAHWSILKTFWTIKKLWLFHLCSVKIGYISHLLSITHGINESFDKENKLKVCFLTDQKHLIRFAIKVSSKSKILRENFEELGLEFLQHKWWYKKPCAFYKILKKIISKRSF